MIREALAAEGPSLGFGAKLRRANWLLVILMCLIAGIGFLMLFSAAEGRLQPWAGRQMLRFATGLVLMLAIAFVDVRHLLRHAYWIYGLAALLLLGVELAGYVGMGARRWLDLGIISLQPSELMKLGLVIALARYFQELEEGEVNRFLLLLPPLAMILFPVLLVLRQPDLGTATLLLGVGVIMLFLAGVALWKFVLAGVVGGVLLPLAWNMLHDYQRRRILTFIDPEQDPLGAGYHILQSKIALGSGGLFGKGLLNGTQSQLDFLPEKQTDFIFTMLAEEAGLMGCILVLALYALVIATCYVVALRSANQFGRLATLGVASILFLHVFINVAMVMGLVPVVGVPLPLISYGGTAMLTLQLGIGIVLSVSIHSDVRIGTRAGMLA